MHLLSFGQQIQVPILLGRKIGKRKLWPDISPNKTIEGFFGGIISAIIFACIFQYFIPIASSYWILSLLQLSHLSLVN